jgi:hypothetical protein
MPRRLSREAPPTVLPTSTRPSLSDRWLTAPKFAIGLALLIVVLFPDFLFGAKTFVFRDFGIFTLPNAAFQRDSFWRGAIPLWNPLDNCGIPFLAQWNMAALYPPALLYLLLPLIPGLNLFALGHLLFAGLGMYLLAFHWTQNRLAAAVAGTAFTFSGMTLDCLMWTSNLAGLAWMPWVVLTMDRAWQSGGKRLAIAALVGALQMLAGAPEIIVFTWLILLGLFLLRLTASQGRLRVLRRAAIAAFLVAGLSAVQLLPFLDLLAHSERNSSYGTGAWAVPLWGWANLFVPLYHCYEQPLGVFFQPGQDWVASYYPGLGVLTLAALALVLAPQPKTWLLAGLAAFGFWVGMGNDGLLYTALLKLFPMLGFMRYPVKFVFLATFALPLLAAIAIAALTKIDRGRPGRPAAWYTGVIIVLSALIVCALLWHAHAHPYRNEQWPVLCHGGLLRLVFLLLVPGMVWLYRARPLPLAAWLLLVFIWADAVTFGPSQNPLVEAAVYRPGLLAQNQPSLPRLGDARAFVLPRVYDLFYHRELKDVREDYLGRRFSLMGDCNILDTVPIADGFYPLHVREQQTLFDAFSQASYDNIVAPGLADFLSISLVSDPDKLLAWQTRPSHLPFYSVGAKPEFLELSNTIPRLLSPDFDPRKTVYLPAEAEGFVNLTNLVRATVREVKFGAEHEEFEIQADAPTLLVLSQTYYHPWRAEVNGQPAKIWRANYAFQAVEIPQGNSQVTFTYRDNLFLMGAVASLIALLACLTALFVQTPAKT